MAQQRKNDSVVNIDAWSLEDEQRSIGRGADEPVTDAPQDLERRRRQGRVLPDQRELLRNEFPED